MTGDIPAATLCLTFGNRPELLRQTLASLAPFDHFTALLGVNDFGDEASTAVFREFCPGGVLVKSPAKRLQHVAIDAMYARVTTPLIMHCEDDWVFNSGDPVRPAYEILRSNDRLSVVGFVEIENYEHWDRHKTADLEYVTAKPEYAYGYMLQPSLLWRSTWEMHGPYARFTSEGRIARHFQKQGYQVAYLTPGLCRHIGESHSVANVRGWQRMRRNVLTRFLKWGYAARAVLNMR
jgi:hypothetical protein